MPNPVFFDTKTMLDAGYTFGAPEERSGLFWDGGSVLSVKKQAGELIIENLLIANVGASCGGSIYSELSESAHMIVHNVVITNSRAISEGGGLYAAVGGNAILEMDKLTIANSRAGYGGGFSIRLSDDALVRLENSVIDNNHVSGFGEAGGGGIIFYGGTAIVRGNLFSRNISAFQVSGLNLYGIGETPAQAFVDNNDFVGNLSQFGPPFETSGANLTVYDEHYRLPIVIVDRQPVQR